MDADASPSRAPETWWLLQLAEAAIYVLMPLAAVGRVTRGVQRGVGAALLEHLAQAFALAVVVALAVRGYVAGLPASDAYLDRVTMWSGAAATVVLVLLPSRWVMPLVLSAAVGMTVQVVGLLDRVAPLTSALVTAGLSTAVTAVAFALWRHRPVQMDAVAVTLASSWVGLPSLAVCPPDDAAAARCLNTLDQGRALGFGLAVAARLVVYAWVWHQGPPDEEEVDATRHGAAAGCCAGGHGFAELTALEGEDSA